MPLPSPSSGQSQDEFVSACMANPTMRSEYPDADQRAAVCHSQWRRKVRRIKKAKIKFLSLVPRGANNVTVIYKDDDSFTFNLLCKQDQDIDDRGEITGIVYAPEHRDKQGDIASAEVIKEMSYDAARNGFNIDVRHDERAIPRDRAFIAESFIVQKGDPRFADMKDNDGNPVDPTGAWGVVVKVDDPELRRLYREGKWSGISMAGQALVEHEKSADPDAIAAALAKRLGLESSGDDDMTKDELTAALKENNDALATTVAEAVAKAIKPEAGDDPNDKKKDTKPESTGGVQKPVFKGDPMKIADVQKHEKAIAKWELAKDVDWDDPTSVAEYRGKLAELQKDKGDDDGDDDPNAKEIKRLEKQIANLRKRSNQTGGTPADDGAELDDFWKEHESDMERGRRIAAIANGEEYKPGRRTG